MSGELFGDGRERAAHVSDDRMRAAFRSLASGVVVVTCWVDGRPWGLTLNSCCSVSTRPPRLLVSLQRHTRSCAAIEAAGKFGVAILGAGQREVAELAAVAGVPKFIDAFCDAREGDRPPSVNSAIWQLECDVHRTFEVGDHLLVVGDVVAAHDAGDPDQEPEPLLYFNRKFRLIGGRPMSRPVEKKGSRTATVVGAGQAGMHLAFGLHGMGWDVTLVSDRTAEQMLASQAMASHGLHSRSMRFEAEAGIDVYDQMVEHPQTGIGFKLSPDGKEVVLDFRSWFSERMRAVDSRYKTALLLESFERQGGRIRYEAATPDDLEAYAEEGLVFLATGKAELGRLFELDEERTTVDKPQRRILLVIVDGMDFDGPDDLRYSSVNFSVIPGLGELFYAPNIHYTNRPVHITLAEAIPGTDADRIDQIKDGDDALRIFKDLVDLMCPWHAKAFAPSQLTDPRAWLAGAVRPLVRRPVATLPSGKSIFGVGDVVVLNDPIAGQGGNCTAYQVWDVLNGIAELEDAPVTPDWYEERFGAFWEARGQYFTGLTNALLNPPNEALQLVFDAVGTDQAVADRLVDAFREPWNFIPHLESVEAAQAMIEEASERPARVAAPV
jgi:flavin reductase (DIM6/NTAB) family NADH-FMN oxidoreductase RutF/2-polyprenyl-6-methoxyphenol hydroxylase-like FAD-dependent oxidoreductase